jgi:hypothetical protein
MRGIIPLTRLKKQDIIIIIIIIGEGEKLSPPYPIKAADGGGSSSTAVSEEISPVNKPADAAIGKTKDTINADLQRVKDKAKAKEAHDRELATKYSKKKPIDKHHHCLMCGKSSEGHNFIPYYNNGKSGYICTSCSMGQTTVTDPVKPDSQTTLNPDEVKV